MHALHILVGAVIGLVAGYRLRFGVALLAASYDPRYDGTYAMREMLVCVPSGALIGLIGGLAVGTVWG